MSIFYLLYNFLCKSHNTTSNPWEVLNVTWRDNKYTIEKIHSKYTALFHIYKYNFTSCKFTLKHMTCESTLYLQSTFNTCCYSIFLVYINSQISMVLARFKSTCPCSQKVLRFELSGFFVSHQDFYFLQTVEWYGIEHLLLLCSMILKILSGMSYHSATGPTFFFVVIRDRL